MSGSAGSYPNVDAGPVAREGTFLASAARTAEVSQGAAPGLTTRINPGFSGVIVTIDATAQGAVLGGLDVAIEFFDQASAKWVRLNAALSSTALSTRAYEVSLNNTAATGNVVQRTSGELPRTWRARVIHADATSYTYSLGYTYVI